MDARTHARTNILTPWAPIKKIFLGFGVEALARGGGSCDNMSCPVSDFGYWAGTNRDRRGQYGQYRSQARTGGRAMWATDSKHTVMLHCDAIQMYVSP